MSSLHSDATARALELPSLLALVAELAATDLGRHGVATLQPADDSQELARRRQRFEEAQRLVLERRLVGGFDRAVGETVEKLASPHETVSGQTLRRLAAMLSATHEARQRILAAEPGVPALAGEAAALPDLRELIRKIDGALDSRGEVRDDASPRLTELRGRIRSARDHLYGDLRRLLDEHRDHLSEETIPHRDGRLMLVLSSGSRGRVPGLVHGRSGTGKSFYFEPLEVVEGNNTLKQASEDEQAERLRIHRELVEAARGALEEIEAHRDFLAALDLLQAAVRFAEVSGGRLAEIAPGAEMRMVEGRHPLLDPRLAPLRERALGTAGHGEPVVPLSLELRGDTRMLVVTGPNAGGKTVALKTIGLLCALHLCGLPVPASAGTRLPLLERLVATVGDEQDLLTDRSTFSGRLLRLKEAWNEAGPASLLLIDELGSGTDPEEGSALSTALLEGLLERGSLGLITTHLTPVAAAALELEGASCAAMEFDPGSGAPTYRLVPGPPGGSEAIALGRRLGLPDEWLDRAESYLGSEHRRLRGLLNEVEELRQELVRERSALESEHRAAERLVAELEGERQAVTEEKRKVGKRLKADLDEFRRKTRQKVGEEVERLRRELEAGRRKGLEAESVGRLFEEAPELAPAEEVEARAPVAGGAVRHRLLGWEGALDKVSGDKAEVLVRGKRLRCKLDELVGLDGPVKRLKEAKRPKASVPAADAVPRELNLIGQRVDPALDELERYLDRALMAAQGEIRVVHGHGSGRLRQAVRQRLHGHPAVATARPGEPNEGGNGATVVRLRI